MPSGHSREHVALAGTENKPAGQTVQSVAVDPNSGLYLPAAQTVQVPPAGVARIVPGEQSLHSFQPFSE